MTNRKTVPTIIFAILMVLMTIGFANATCTLNAINEPDNLEYVSGNYAITFTTVEGVSGNCSAGATFLVQYAYNSGDWVDIGTVNPSTDKAEYNKTWATPNGCNDNSEACIDGDNTKYKLRISCSTPAYCSGTNIFVSGNPASTIGLDNTAPTIGGALTQDNNLDGTVDGVLVQIADGTGSGMSACDISGWSENDGSCSISACSVYNSTTLNFNLSGCAEDTSITPTINYTAASGSTTDAAGNELTSGNTGVAVDGANPVVVSLGNTYPTISESVVGDNAFNVSVTFSENMNTGVNPTITFSPSVSSTLTICSNTWSTSTEFIYNCTVADADVELTDIDFSASGAEANDDNSLTQIYFTTINGLFDIDTLQPTVVSATAVPDPAIAGLVTVTVEFSEDIDAESATVEVTGLITDPYSVTETDVTGSTWTGTFTLLDENETETATISVADATDLAGNIMDADATNTFDVDTVSPTVDAVTVSHPVILAEDAGETFTITIDYDEDMDQSANPTITFSAFDGTLNLTSREWLSSTSYMASYLITDDDVHVLDIDLSIGGVARDVAGNLHETGSSTAAFDVDTITPWVNAWIISDMQLDEVLVGSNYTVGMNFTEAMNTGVAPNWEFVPSVASSLTACVEGWMSTILYQINCTIVDDNISDAYVNITAIDAVDALGNPQAEFNRYVAHIDTLQPTVVSATATPSLAKDGLVTIAVDFSETLSVSPTVTILGLAGSPIAVDESSLVGSLWIGNFTLVDTNELETATISVVDAEDTIGNVMAANATAGTFEVDTISPTATVSVSHSVILEANVSQVFSVIVDYDETMNTSVVPQFNFDAVPGTLITLTGAWFNTTRYVSNYTITDDNVMVVSNPVDIGVNTNAIDLAGNAQDAKTQVDAFIVDTITPTVVGVSIVNQHISEAEAGQKFSLVASYSENMAVTIPTVTFSPTVATSLTGCSGSWLNATEFEYNCTIADADVEVNALNATFSDAYDVLGNIQNSYKQTGMDIDTVKPTVGTVVITPSWDGGSTTYISVLSNISAEVSDAGQGIDSGSCEYTLNGTDWVLATYDDGECYADNVDTSLATDINFRVNDSANNVGTGSAISVTLDLAAPVLSDVSMSPVLIISGDTITVLVNVTDSETGIASATATINGTAHAMTQEGTSGKFKYIGTFTGADGIYSVSVTAADAVGNVAAAQTINFEVSADAVNMELLENRIAVLNQGIISLNTTVQNLSDRTATLEGNVSTLRNDVSTLQGNVSTLQAEIDSINGNITTLFENATEQLNMINSLNGSLDSVNSTLTDVSTKLDAYADFVITDTTDSTSDSTPFTISVGVSSESICTYDDVFEKTSDNEMNDVEEDGTVYTASISTSRTGLNVYRVKCTEAVYGFVKSIDVFVDVSSMYAIDLPGATGGFTEYTYEFVMSALKINKTDVSTHNLSKFLNSTAGPEAEKFNSSMLSSPIVWRWDSSANDWDSYNITSNLTSQNFDMTSSKLSYYVIELSSAAHGKSIRHNLAAED